MRVIAGTHRSRILEQVDSDNTRETKDRVKESIFNSISNYIPDSQFLDLFSGSGSLGIEALSRGAKHVVLNDFNADAYKVLQNNIKTLDLSNDVTLYKKDYESCLKELSSSFDVILLDPPYKLNVVQEVIHYIDEHKLLLKSGIIVILSDNDRVIDDTNNFETTKSKKMGKTKVTYMKWRVL